MLDARMLQDMPPGCVFATGQAIDGDTGINMARTGKILRWIACRGEGTSDWAIYYDYEQVYKSQLELKIHIAEIKMIGDKVTFEKHIKHCVPCHDDAYERYRL